VLRGLGPRPGTGNAPQPPVGRYILYLPSCSAYRINRHRGALYTAGRPSPARRSVPPAGEHAAVSGAGPGREIRRAAVPQPPFRAALRARAQQRSY